MLDIAVIIPAYNSGNFLGEAIDSVLGQTLRPKEIVVVDDCSADGTRELARDYGGEIELLANERNAGPGYSRNRGVAHAKSRWIAFLDADDVWRKDHLERKAALLEKHPEVPLAFGPQEGIGNWGGTWPPQLEKTGEPYDYFAAQLQGGVIQTSSILMNREAFAEAGGFDEIVRFRGKRRVQAEDLDLTLKVSYRHPAVADDQPTTYYRGHEGQSYHLAVDQCVVSHEYRFRFLETLAHEERNSARVQEGIRRLKTRWDLTLRYYWDVRDVRSLRRLVAYGLSRRLLGRETLPYVWRCAPGLNRF